MVGRREALRAELLASVREAARDQLQEAGPADLSLRAIARDVGISPAGLYRYYDGRDALLTMLITDGYTDLADHLFLAQGLADEVSDLDRERRVPDAVAADAAPLDRLRATWRTYRAWALAHPNEFHLLFGQPVAGYAAPVDGDTTRANARMSRALVLPAFVAWRAGDLVVPELAEPPTGAERLASVISQEAPVPVSAAFAARTLAWWSVVHGAVALELNGQFAWLDDDATGALFAATVEATLEACRPAG